MKKHLSILFVILLLFALPASAFEELEQVGGVYQISTAKELGIFRNWINSGDIPASSNAKLTADIKLTESWKPIGWSARSGDTITDYSYRGTFDGNGFVVQNLTVTSKDLVPAYRDGIEHRVGGFFGVLSSGACVFDLSIEGVLIDASDYSAPYVHAGAIAGVVLSGDIRNCTLQSADISAGDDAGGIVGKNYGNIQNCTVQSADISAGDDAGGVVGENGGNIENCTVTGGTITAGYYAGGVAGYNYTKDSNIQNCTVMGGTITGMLRAGGVAGYNLDGTIQSCTVTGGTITGVRAAGGVAGHNSGNIRNCAVFGVTVSADAKEDNGHSGAISGYNNGGNIQNCVAMDDEKTSVSASADAAYAGGALGWIDANKASISYTYYPAGIVNTSGIFSAQGDKPHEWAIGNVPPEEMPAAYKEVTSYDAELLPKELPIITAIIKQGISVTIAKGAPYELDLTTLPGTSGDVTCAWSIEGEDTGILTIDPATGLQITVTGVELGEAFVKCNVTGLPSGDGGYNNTLDLSCRVTVVEATTPTGGGSSSNCNSGVGVALFALAGLFLVGKRKK